MESTRKDRSKKKKDKRRRSLRPRSREASNNNCTSLMKGITKIGTFHEKPQKCDA
jgi:hypothetical protein